MLYTIVRLFYLVNMTPHKNTNFKLFSWKFLVSLIKDSVCRTEMFLFIFIFLVNSKEWKKIENFDNF